MIERPSYLEQLIRHKDSDLIKVVTGMRRSGKSVLLLEIFTQWLREHGVPESAIITIDLEDIENMHLRDASALYQHIISRVTSHEPHYVIIDEIQHVSGFTDVVNSLKKRSCDVYITGSNSHLLSSDIATEMRGRATTIHVHPLSFSEYYSASDKNREEAFQEYMLYGGMPYIANRSNVDEKIQYLKMI